MRVPYLSQPVPTCVPTIFHSKSNAVPTVPTFFSIIGERVKIGGRALAQQATAPLPKNGWNGWNGENTPARHPLGSTIQGAVQ